ncbi:MAG: protein-L-isoaspartate O-methyltransferase [Myxococcaceae bacterium]
MHDLNLTDARVKAAMQLVDRRDFLPPARRGDAGVDAPIGIGYAQTTSQPSLIGWMIEQLHVRPGARVLEVGTGCGYQTAVLAQLGAEVFSVEIVEPLGKQAAQTLARLEVPNVHLRIGDGYAGWPEAAPFDAIIVAAGAAKIPRPLIDQLAPGGRLLMPIGNDEHMDLVLATREKTEKVLPVRFVPLTGELAEADRDSG